MPVPHRSQVRGFTLALLVVALAIPNITAASTIGLYTDESGSSCSFSGNDPGPVTAYVVVRPDAAGVQAMRFSAVIPPCLGAVLVSETAPLGALTIGSSETGISIGLPFCAPSPTYALAITYMRTGSTTPCCEFTITEDPFVGSIEGIDCAFNTTVLTPVTSHFNADASCPCVDADAPQPPAEPFPPHGATLIAVGTNFLWSPAPYDYDIVGYDFYVGTSEPLALAATVTQPSYQPPQPLAPATQYFWRVIVRDNGGRETPGPVWTFTTRPVNSPPSVSLFNPPNGQINTSMTPALMWTASDIDFDPLTYDVYLGTAASPPLVATNVTQVQYLPPALLPGTNYYWKVVARDPLGLEATSATWTFTTFQPGGQPPTVPAPVAPPDGSTNRPLSQTLSWQSSDPEGFPVKFDVYFGSNPAPSLVASNHPSTTYFPGALAQSTTYYWRIVARDFYGLTTSGPLWSFSTGSNSPPHVPTLLLPANGAIDLAPNLVRFFWSATDPDGNPLLFDMYLGTTPSPPLLWSGWSSTTFEAYNTLAPSTTYWWKVVAHDTFGPGTESATWSFTTGVPGIVVGSPYPPNHSNWEDAPQYLNWSAVDPNGLPLTYNLYFGSSMPPPLVASGLTSEVYPLSPLPDGIYFWNVVASNGTQSGTGPIWTFSVGDAPLPVLISSFKAVARDGGIDVNWKLESDEAMDRYTLYRRTGTLQPMVIAEASVDENEGSFLDRSVEPATKYSYELAIRTTDGDIFRSPVATATSAAVTLTLHQNHPNPFNPQTTIRYDLPGGSERTRVRLLILDIAGRVVSTLVDEDQAGGTREVVWKGMNDRGETVSSGVYFYVLDAGGERMTKKLVLLK